MLLFPLAQKQTFQMILLLDSSTVILRIPTSIGEALMIGLHYVSDAVLDVPLTHVMEMNNQHTARSIPPGEFKYQVCHVQ